MIDSKSKRKMDYKDWWGIVAFLKSCEDIRKSVCASCFSAKIYDKNNNPHLIDGRRASLKEVKDLVENIRK